MNGVEALREGLGWANQLLAMVTSNMTEEQAHWHPQGIANPAGAQYAHALVGEDAVINGLLRGGVPLYARAWAGRTGISEPQMQADFEWARRVRIVLPDIHAYANAVYESGQTYLSSLTDEDLDRDIDLTGYGFGVRTAGWVLNSIVIGHVNNMAGEISVIKGLQGAQGYPF